MSISLINLQNNINNNIINNYELELNKQPYNLKLWLNYLNSNKNEKHIIKYKIYEKALIYLPRSYKLWHMYINEILSNLYQSNKCLTDKRFEFVIKLFDRCLVYMNKMPVIWQEYLTLLTRLRLGSRARDVFDAALRALPGTQHPGLWDLYLPFVTSFGVLETALLAYHRLLLRDSSHRDSFIDFLQDNKLYGEVVKQLIICINDDNYISSKSKTKHDLYIQLCDLCAQYPNDVSRYIKVDSVIRSGINKFSDEIGILWCRLADYYIRLGLFEKARDIYEEAIHSVITVRDFTIIFESYAKFEESVILTKLNITTLMEEQLNDNTANELNILIENKKEITLIDINNIIDENTLNNMNIKQNDIQQYIIDKKDIMLRLARLEYIIELRPLLLNAVILRQNPHNIFEWHKRIKIYRNEYFTFKSQMKKNNINNNENNENNDILLSKFQRVVSTYMDAINTINPKLAKGKFCTIWLSFASFYENNYSNNKLECIENARIIYRKATLINFRHIDELATIWCSWVEMEIIHNEYDRALLLMKEVITEPIASIERRKLKAIASGKQKTNKNSFQYIYSDGDIESNDNIPIIECIYKHVKIWELYLDLEESLGTIESVRTAYDRTIEIGIVTPQMILNYGKYLEENYYFEDSFRIYERSISIFGFPHIKKIWITYINKFIERYGGKKLERLRDLFEQVLLKAPIDDKIEFYILYSKMEEQYGLARHALSIYDRATKDIMITSDDLKYHLFLLFINKTGQLYGITKTRSIYERAIQELGDENSSKICLLFAEMECKLGEIDRTRAIYQHGSQLIDPKHDKLLYWNKWKDFEENYGNEDTFRDMLRMKRSAEVAFSQINYMATELIAAQSNSTITIDNKNNNNNNNAITRLSNEIELQHNQLDIKKQIFIPSNETNKLTILSTDNNNNNKRNVEEINIDDIEEEGEEENNDNIHITQKQIPNAVFGKLAESMNNRDNQPNKIMKMN